jgi:hypothetical protein
VLCTFYGAIGGWHLWWAVHEVWASGVVLAALLALTYRRAVLSAALLTAAFAIREFAALFVPVLFVYWALGSRRLRTLGAPVLAVAGCAAVFALHVVHAPTEPGPTVPIQAWLQGGWQVYLDHATFGYLGLPLREQLPPLFPLALLGAAAFAAVRPWKQILLYIGTAVPAFLFAFGNEWSWYWGAMFTPATVSGLPIAFAKVWPGPALLPQVAAPAS